MVATRPVWLSLPGTKPGREEVQSRWRRAGEAAVSRTGLLRHNRAQESTTFKAERNLVPLGKADILRFWQAPRRCWCYVGPRDPSLTLWEASAEMNTAHIAFSKWEANFMGSELHEIILFSGERSTQSQANKSRFILAWVRKHAYSNFMVYEKFDLC